MARLQRKKASISKKKKKTDTDVAPSQTSADVPVKKPGILSATNKEAASPRSRQQTRKAAVPVKQEPNIVDKSLQFLREVKVELKKVAWPSRKQTMGSTVVVIVLVMIISFFLGAVDLGLSGLISAVLQ